MKILSKPHNDETLVKGFVVFSRGNCPDWITPIFQMMD